MMALRGRRVLILFPHLVQPGGALLYTLRLADQLAQQGAWVGVLTLQWDSRRGIEIPSGVDIVDLKGPLTSKLGFWILFPLWQWRINAAIDHWQPHVLVSQVFPSNWWGWLYKRKNRHLPLLWICHEPSAFIHSANWIGALRPRWKGWLARRLRPVLAPLDQKLFRYGDRNVANSRFTALEMERVYGVTPDAIAFPGIDLSTTAAFEQERNEALLTVAHLSRFKRVDFLLRVFATVAGQRPRLKYHIVGVGEELTNLQALARELGVADRVTFHGTLSAEALAQLYGRVRLFVHGSIGEPFGMAPLEAMAYGTPVVAHDSGGPREFVGPDGGFLVASEELADWVWAIEELLDGRQQSADTAETVRRCAARFDWSETLRPAVGAVEELCQMKENPR